MTDRAVAIHCEVSGKRIARRDTQGIYLWCKECKTEHLIRWQTPDNDKVHESNQIAPEAGSRRSG